MAYERRNETKYNYDDDGSRLALNLAEIMATIAHNALATAAGNRAESSRCGRLGYEKWRSVESSLSSWPTLITKDDDQWSDEYYLCVSRNSFL